MKIITVYDTDGIEKLKNTEILFITDWLDTTVPMEELIIPTYRHFKKLNPEFVSIIAFETDHNLTNKRDVLANSISEWIKSKKHQIKRINYKF